MTNEGNIKSPESIARRKEFLLAQGVVYRSGLRLAQSDVRASLHPGSLLQSAVTNIAMFGYAAMKSRVQLSGLRTVLPLLIGGITAISRKALIKPLLGGALILGAVGAIANVVIKQKKARKLKRQQDSQRAA